MFFKFVLVFSLVPLAFLINSGIILSISTKEILLEFQLELPSTPCQSGKDWHHDCVESSNACLSTLDVLQFLSPMYRFQHRESFTYSIRFAPKYFIFLSNYKWYWILDLGVHMFSTSVWGDNCLLRVDLVTLLTQLLFLRGFAEGDSLGLSTITSSANEDAFISIFLTVCFLFPCLAFCTS